MFYANVNTQRANVANVVKMASFFVVACAVVAFGIAVYFNVLNAQTLRELLNVERTFDVENAILNVQRAINDNEFVMVCCGAVVVWASITGYIANKAQKQYTERAKWQTANGYNN